MSSFSSDDAKRFEALKSRPGLSGNTRVTLERMHAHGLIMPGKSYLGVGAGDGELEHHLAANHSARVGYIDPSGNLAALFEKRMKESSLESRIADFCTAEAAAAKLEHEYHCALAVHSWYYIGYAEQTLKKLTAALVPGGALGILLHAEDSIVDRISGFKESAARPVRAEPLLAWIRTLGYRAALDDCSDEAPAGRYLNEDGTFTGAGRSWISYMLRVEEGAVAAGEWARCRDILATEGSRIVFKYGWIKIDR